MREPNFSESQLQQAVNTAYVREIFEKHGDWMLPVVPSLHAEFELGWDTGFFFPWLPPPPTNSEGCNFFLQYKLSGELISSGAKEWSHWQAPYFRFKVPHSTASPKTGGSFDDYHQWERLKSIADQDYPTFYATNFSLDRADLASGLQAGTLLNDLPLLDVRDVTGKHKHVTFTKTSTHFLLHSEPETTSKKAFSVVLESLTDHAAKPIARAVEDLASTLRKLFSEDASLLRDLDRLNQDLRQFAPAELRSWIKHAGLSWILRKHFNTQLHWFPKSS